MTRLALSAVVPSFNNEDIIEDCLRSVVWADEIVVCDSFSSDRTLEIAGRYAHRVIQHEYRNSAAQKNWAIPQLTHPWVLIVDTDERVTPKLRAEILQVLEEGTHCAGFRIPRANHLSGRWLRHGDNWPDYQIRLFQRDLGRYKEREVHAHIVLNGPCGTLEHPLLHFPHRSLTSMRRVILQRYTTWEAMEKRHQGVCFHWYQLLVRPAGVFVQRYIVKRGYRDGWQGLLMATVWTCYVFITYYKLHRLEQRKSM